VGGQSAFEATVSRPDKYTVPAWQEDVAVANYVPVTVIYCTMNFMFVRKNVG